MKQQTNKAGALPALHQNRRLFARFLVFCLVLMLALCSVSCAETVPAPDENSLQVTFIDVSKGDCILVQKGNSAVLIDAGYDATSSTVLYYLQEHGIEALDYMIITHYDKDHVGGAAFLADNIEIANILLPAYEGEGKLYNNLMDAISKHGIRSQKITADFAFSLEDVNYTVMASNIEFKAGEDGKEGNDNDCSLVVSAVYGEDSFLFAGDIEKAGIKAYLKAHTGKYDIIKMPHHGSMEKNTEDLLEATVPAIAVITDSTGDPADAELLACLKAANIRAFRSSANGNITITGQGTGEYNVSTEK